MRDMLSPRLTTWIERFAADIPSADHPDYLEGVIDGIRLTAAPVNYSTLKQRRRCTGVL